MIAEENIRTDDSIEAPQAEVTPGRSEDEQRRWEEARRQIKQRRVNRLEKRWWKRRAVNLFIIWQAFAICVWVVPGNSALVQVLSPVVRPYLVMTAFAQSWSMFSPNPDKMDVYMEARITYANGQTKSWDFPRMVHMNYAKRIEEERWRKMTEVVTHGGNHQLWRPLARYAARVNDTDPKNPPVKVELFQHSRVIPPPGQPIPGYEVTPMQDSIYPAATIIHPGDLVR